MNHEQYSLGYDALRVYARWLHKMIHRRITIAGMENLPKDKPIIFAPNHQNALMDAMAVLLATKHQPTWLARADIFKNKTIRKILYFLKISPVYRMRDGKENLGKNDAVFELAVRVLKNNKSLALFPEGQHTFKRQTAAHKKAVPRIAFMAEEREDFTLDIHIVPTGLFYDHYNRFNRELIVTFGEPVKISDFKKQYQENPGAAAISLRNEIYAKLIPLTLQIHSKEHYDEYELLREVFRNDLPKNTKPVNKLEQEKQFIRNVEAFEKGAPKKAEEILKYAEEYRNKLSSLKISDEVVRLKNAGLRAFAYAFLSGITLPVFLYGWLNFFLGFHLPSVLIRKKIKDEVFWATVEYVAWIMTIPIFLLIHWGVVWIVTGNFWYAMIYLVTLPLFGKAALYLKDFYKRTLQQVRWTTSAKPVRVQLKKLRKKITVFTGKLS